MNLLEKYKYYQKGIVKAGVTEKLQKFFKTNPSEEQIMMLDDISRINEAITWLIALFYLILGVALGWAIYHLQASINALVGV